jgi:hypothetical protein
MQPRSYTLKTMVFVRMFAEITVFLGIVALPIYLLATHQFSKLPPLIQALQVVAAIVCALILPVYGFITYKVSVDIDGLRTHALFRRQFIQWDHISGLRLRTAFAWRRYVVIAGDESVSFPIWLVNIDELVDQIRAVLPQGGRMLPVGGVKVFAQDALATAFTIFKLVSTLIFIAIFWMFFVYLESHKSKHADPSDAIVILAGCLIFTAIMLWRSYSIAMMPRMVSTDESGITYRTWFRQTETLPWSDLSGVAPPFFLLPEGIVVKAKNRKQILIGNDLDAFDELQDELRERAPAAKG